VTQEAKAEITEILNLYLEARIYFGKKNEDRIGNIEWESEVFFYILNLIFCIPVINLTSD